MRFVVFGAGAVGGVVGGRLAQAGHDVTLVARGEHGSAIRRGGLRLEWPEGAATLELPTVAVPNELEFHGDETVLLATKSQDTLGATQDLAQVAPPETQVVCLQNGVANERTASRFFARVYGVPVLCPAEHVEPGIVAAQSAPITGILDIGRFPRGADSGAAEIADAFRSATFESEVREEVMPWKYRKLLLNLANAVEAACAAGTGRRALIHLLRDEAEAVLAAAGIAVVTAAEDAARRGNLLTIREVAGRPRGGSSTWQSLARGTGSVETDFLNGEIVLLGRLHDIATPANALVQRVVRELAAAGGEPGSLNAGELLAQLRPPR